MCGGLFKLLVAAREEGKVPAPDPAFDQEQVSYRIRAGCSLLRAEGFFCNLDVLYRGLEIGKL
jgi:hypothetical protein